MNLKKITATVLAILTISSVASVPVNAQGWINSNNAIYYQLSNGNYATGWEIIGNYEYYFKSSGKAATGFQKIGDIKIIKLVNKVLGRVFMQREVQKFTSGVTKETLKDTIETVNKFTEK